MIAGPAEGGCAKAGEHASAASVASRRPGLLFMGQISESSDVLTGGLDSVRFISIMSVDMKVSSRGLYALKALTHLAEAYERGLVKIHEIAEEEQIPEKFLEGILVTLKNARIVASQRGREGGYRLHRPPGEIQIGRAHV